VPELAKPPRSSAIRFQADQPNRCWQSDFTHYQLTRPNGRPGADVEIISWLDGHSGLALEVLRRELEADLVYRRPLLIGRGALGSSLGRTPS